MPSASYDHPYHRLRVGQRYRWLNNNNEVYRVVSVDPHDPYSGVLFFENETRILEHITNALPLNMAMLIESPSQDPFMPCSTCNLGVFPQGTVINVAEANHLHHDLGLDPIEHCSCGRYRILSNTPHVTPPTPKPTFGKLKSFQEFNRYVSTC